MPCLQELTEEEEKPKFVVESFDTWFQEDSAVIDRLFKRENNDSLAEIWTGMFQYYTEKFQFDKNLIQDSFSMVHSLWNSVDFGATGCSPKNKERAS